jgi:spermidine/putrescine transport system ATP-binding protein
MADTIAVMNEGRIEQLGAPSELYEHPRTAFVAGFLGVSNLLPGRVAGRDRVVLEDGTEVVVAPGALDGRAGRVAVGVRPEKVRLGGEEANAIAGTMQEIAYVGASSQYLVATPAGVMTVYVQNAQPGQRPAAAGDAVRLAWSPEATFVVDVTKEDEPE